jgi:hypothetical protein
MLGVSQLHAVRGLVNRRTFKQLADKFHLVYFGHVNPRDDDYELVRGVTVSTTHVDNYYTVGTIKDHDVIMVERSNNIHFPGKPPTHYSWVILQVDLHRGGLPHIFVDIRQQDETFYSTLFTKLPQFQDITHIFSGRDNELVRRGKVFGYPQHYAEIGEVLTPEVTLPLIRDYKQFDYEIHGDKLYIYASKIRPTLVVLQDMVHVGLTLAQQLDSLVIS